MKILITGGCGFIGSNLADAFATDGHSVIVADNLSRKGVKNNRDWLIKNHSNIEFVQCDIREKLSLLTFASFAPDVIFHLAAQVGVQESIKRPYFDFSVNALGTLNILELSRSLPKKPLVVFASTNKVYGDIEFAQPVSEDQPLKFCTPYGCSKGAAEQYVLDYFRIYGVPSVVLRMSCIYGNRQFGTEEQGWLAHFMKSAWKNELVIVYGDGEQVRDVLYIDDYVNLCKLLVTHQDIAQGQVFNVGGGNDNKISVNKALEKIALMGNRLDIEQAPVRPADQKYYVSDITKAQTLLNWQPTIGVDEGLERLSKWIKTQK